MVYLNPNIQINSDNQNLSGFIQPKASNKCDVLKQIIPFCKTQDIKSLAKTNFDLREAVLEHSLEKIGQLKSKFQIPSNIGYNETELTYIALHGHLSDRRLIAKNLNTPQTLLAAMRFDASIEVKIKLALNHNLPQKAFDELLHYAFIHFIRYNNNYLFRAIAANPNIPKSMYNHVLIRQCTDELLSNPNTPTHILENMNLNQFAEHLAVHPNLSNLKIRQLAQLGDPYVDSLLLTRPNLPLDDPKTLETRPLSLLEPLNGILVKLQIEGKDRLFSIPLDTEQQLKMIQPHTPLPFLELLAKYGRVEIQQALLKLNNLHPQLEKILASSKSGFIHMQLVKRADISKEALACLAFSPVDKVRLKVAQRLEDDFNSALLLAYDHQPSVQLEALKRFSFSQDIIETICLTSESKVRQFIAEKSQLNSRMTQDLMQDPKIAIRKALLANSSISTPGLYAMRKDKAPEIAVKADRLFNKRVSVK